MARRQEAQDTSPTKWQPKETVSNEDNRQPSAIMTELLQGKKKYSANDLYGLPKACQEAVDLALICPNTEQIIQNTTDPGIKARFQHIREARVLVFKVNPYTRIDAVDLPFSFEEFQYLRYHFEVFSVVAPFDLMIDEKERMAQLDTYLDTRDVRIVYQEWTRKALQDQVPTLSEPKVET
ncbi:beta-glucosidase 24-like [Pyrus ussuriensis x Pyrus communis]|uniref:Beta-glucosidase 24-like n=1 Tax=Pyrus ussuriensis x Pyrus communis TaxID=2448454 RepID=A0A5N5GW41_9ROSA|nr:beta-glucosidase 24-like [Pyrus ussuriensis x Pyrus communis]